jgi:hypothetical protein
MDSKGGDIEFVRSVRDDIEQRVLTLLGEFGVTIGRSSTRG